MRVLILVMFMVLSGCGIFTKKLPDAIITEKTVKVDPRVLEPCKDLLTLQKPIINDYQIVELIAKNIDIYVDCRTKQENSIKVIKEFSNQEGPK